MLCGKAGSQWIGKYLGLNICTLLCKKKRLENMPHLTRFALVFFLTWCLAFIVFSDIKILWFGASELAQLVKAFATKLNDLSSISGFHKVE